LKNKKNKEKQECDTVYMAKTTHRPNNYNSNDRQSYSPLEIGA